MTQEIMTVECTDGVNTWNEYKLDNHGYPVHAYSDDYERMQEIFDNADSDGIVIENGTDLAEYSNEEYSTEAFQKFLDDTCNG